MLRKYTPRSRRLTALFCSMILAAALLIQAVPFVRAADGVSNRYDRLSTSIISATGIHLIGFTYTNQTDPVGSVEFEFCTNDPLPGTPCTIPSGLDLTGATLTDQSGETGFTIDASSTSNRILLTRPASVPVVGASYYEFTDVVNPDTPGTYYIRLRTFTATDGTGPALEYGGIAIAINRLFNVAAEVPPYLRLCAGVVITAYDCTSASSFLIDLGEFRNTQTSRASSQFVVATNAPYGFTVSLAGTTLTSGNNVIPALATPTGSSAGTSQFGVNLRSNTNPAIGEDPAAFGVATGTVTPDYDSPNLFKFVNGDSLVTSVTTTDNQKFTVSYIANVNSGQPAGYYATTVSFIALANF
jgi:hypothetical protein